MRKRNMYLTKNYIAVKKNRKRSGMFVSDYSYTHYYPKTASNMKYYNNLKRKKLH